MLNNGLGPSHTTGESMERYAPVLLDVWRECCRHIEIEESLARGAALLADRLPFEWIVVRRLDAGRGVVETAATAGRRPGTPAFAPRATLEPPELE